MDAMIQSYMEETEEMLQKAEECIIRLEKEYSSVDVNELFRIAHTIKGSSHMVGYEDIGNLMHRIEDLLDCARIGSILFDQSIVSLCFEGLDTVKKMLQFKTEPCSSEIMEEHICNALRISESVKCFIKTNKVEKEKSVIQAEEGIISTLLNKDTKGKYKYYITFFIEEDVPMVSPVLMIILKSIENIGTLVYSSVTDDFFSGNQNDDEIRTFDTIICTDIDQAELYTYFALFYVEKINIMNLTRSIHEKNDYCFNETDFTPYVTVLRVIMNLYNIVFSQPVEYRIHMETQYIIKNLHCEAIDALERLKNKNKDKIIECVTEFDEVFNSALQIYNEEFKTDKKFWSNSQLQIKNLIEGLYNKIKGKYIVYIIKSENEKFMDNLKNFISMVNKSITLIILIDISKLNILHEEDIKSLIEINEYLNLQGIEISIVADGSSSRRIINIFDSIKSIKNFRIFASELDAILGMFQEKNCFNRIIKRITDLELVDRNEVTNQTQIS